MVTRSKNKTAGEKEQKKGRVKIGKLKLNRETVKDLTSDEARRIKGGIGSAQCAQANTGGANIACRTT